MQQQNWFCDRRFYDLSSNKGITFASFAIVTGEDISSKRRLSYRARFEMSFLSRTVQSITRTVTNRCTSNSNGDGVSNHTSRDDHAINRRALYHRFHDQIRYPRSQRGAYTSRREKIIEARARARECIADARKDPATHADRPQPATITLPASISIISKSRLPFAI